MESCSLDLHPERGHVHVALFQNVTNAADLRVRLDQKDASLTCALVDATIIMNLFHILLAVNRACQDERQNKLKTQNLYSEIVFDFSSTTDIAQSLRRFGIDNTTTSMVAITIGGTPDEAKAFMQGTIHGDLMPLDTLDRLRDIKRIQKYYQTGDQGQDLDKMMGIIAGAMALKGHKKS